MKRTPGVAAEVRGDSFAAFARMVGMQAVARIAIDKNWAALRLKIV